MGKTSVLRAAVLLPLAAILLTSSACSFNSHPTENNTEASLEYTVPDSAGTSVLTCIGANETKSDETLQADSTDESAVIATGSGVLNLSDSNLKKTGDSSSTDDSEREGLNAAVLAENASNITMEDCNITTDGDGASAVFSTDDNSKISLSNSVIGTSSDSSKGIAAVSNGMVNAEGTTVTTSGRQSAAIYAGNGGGTITVTGGSMTTCGGDSPGVYSAGSITVTDAVVCAENSQAAAIKGTHYIVFNKTELSGQYGVLMYQDDSGDTENGTSECVMNGGSFTAGLGPLFHVTNTDGIIQLTGTKLSCSSGIILATDANVWGIENENGGTVSFKADSETLDGDIVCDKISSAAITLQNNTAFSSAVNRENSGGKVSLSLDKTSVWSVKATSYITSLADSDLTLSNIHSNGFNVFYDATDPQNSWLAGSTVTLDGGGLLTPAI